MEKVSIKPSNRFCPQAMFLYGTYKEDGKPNFGLFVWLSYCWDGELAVMACIGDEKLTKDRIRAGKVFSANLVSEALLPLADYFGNNEGYDPKKMDIPLAVERGSVLPVPVLKESPWAFELEAKQTVTLDGSEVYICKIHNVIAAKALVDDSFSAEERMRLTAPVIWASSVGNGKYFSVNPAVIGTTGDWKNLRTSES